jgi:hypothetical protein
MTWTKALSLFVAAALLAAPASALPELSMTSVTVQDYAAREAQATDLEGFTGGWHGVVITVVVVVLLVWLISEIIYHNEGTVHIHTHKRGPVHP